MAASLMNMLDDLEARLERTQEELQALREENQRLKQQLSGQAGQAPGREADSTVGVQHQRSAGEPHITTKAPEVVSVKDDGVLPSEAPTPPPSPNALLNSWYERYPKAFFKGHTKPLKVGIHQDLAEREEWPNKLIRRALANYVNLPRYIKAVRIGAERVDLDGNPAGKVDKEAASHAAEKRSYQKGSLEPTQDDSLAKKREHNKQHKVQAAAQKPRPERVKQPQPEESEPSRKLSMEEKLLGLQQKFKGR
jgi:ProP effector